MTATTPERLGPENGRPRLLVLDAPGGPHPRRYAPILGALADLDVFYLPSFLGGGDEQARRDILQGWGRTYRVDERAHLPELLDAHVESTPVDGVLAFSEIMVQHAAVVAERLGVPHNSVRATRLMKRKDLQRKALEEHGLPVPAWRLIHSASDLAEAASIGFPAVCKPVVGMGGVSVRLVRSLGELSEVYDELRAQYLADPRMSGHQPTFMLEALLPGLRWHENPRFGDYVSVESLVVDGTVSHLAITDKLPLAYPFRETGDVMPSTLPSHLQQEILEVASAAIGAMEATSGGVHTEIKLTADGPRVIEVNGRVGGGIAELLAETSDFDIIAELGKIALGLPPRHQPLFHGYAAFLTPQPEAGDVRVRAVHGVDRLRRLPGIKDVHLVHGAGAVPNWRAGTNSNIVRLYALSPTFDGLLALMDLIDDTLLIELEELQPIDAAS